MGRLSERVVLITGAAGAIGAAIARSCAAEKAKLVLCDINQEAGDILLEEIRGLGVEASYHSLNVANEQEWKQVVDAVSDQYGGIDVLVNNAGVTLVRPIEETSVQEIDWVMKINVHGPFLGIKHATASLKARSEEYDRSSSIVNISSIFSVRGFPFGTVYSMSKGALRSLTRSAALEFANQRTRIRVNTVLAGVVDTPLLEQELKTLADFELMGAKSIVQVRALVRSRIPLDRFAQPADVAKQVTYLASDDSEYVTGSEFTVDGGALA